MMKIKGMRIRGRKDLKALLKAEVADISESDLEDYSLSLEALWVSDIGRPLIEGHIDGVKEIYQERKTQSPDSQPSIAGMPEIVFYPSF